MREASAGSPAGPRHARARRAWRPATLRRQPAPHLSRRPPPAESSFPTSVASPRACGCFRRFAGSPPAPTHPPPPSFAGLAPHIHQPDTPLSTEPPASTIGPSVRQPDAGTSPPVRRVATGLPHARARRPDALSRQPDALPSAARLTPHRAPAPAPAGLGGPMPRLAPRIHRPRRLRRRPSRSPGSPPTDGHRPAAPIASRPRQPHARTCPMPPKLCRIDDFATNAGDFSGPFGAFSLREESGLPLTW